MNYSTRELLEDLIDAMANYRSLQLKNGDKNGAQYTAGHILRIKEELADPYQALKEAQARGEAIQCFGDWRDVGEPEWTSPATSYRIKPGEQS